MPAVSIIIVNYNGGALLTKTVAALSAQSFANFECLILDNGSRDRSIADLPPLDDRFIVQELGENFGFAKTNNIGAKQARAPWIITLNPDAIAMPNWLENLMAIPAKYDWVRLAGSTQLMIGPDDTVPTHVNTDEPQDFDGAGDCYHVSGIAYRAAYHYTLPIPNTGMVFGPCAAAALYHRETFLALGGFDERFFCYHEDVDLAFRFQLAGHDCVQSAEAIVFHVGSAISDTVPGFAMYHGSRNRIWTFFKNMPWPLLILLLPLHLGANGLYVLLSFRKGRLPSIGRGVRHGLFGIPAMWASRRNIQSRRKIGLMTLFHRMGKSPTSLLRRTIHIRPLP